MDQSSDSVFEDLAKGALYGAFCGDAIGSYVEFQSTVSPKQVDAALLVPGGGPFKLAKGQITDDSELALCLGHGLVEGKGTLNLNSIAKYYSAWVQSNPFDVGMTIGTAFKEILKEKKELAYASRRGAKQSEGSQSNGALMRIIPLCIWASDLNREDLMECIEEETRLTHPNTTAIDVSISFAYAIQHLLKNQGDSEGAFLKAKAIIKHRKNKDVEKWIEEVERNKLPLANEKIGWVKIAFCYALYFLKHRTSYREAMKEMLSKAGDTDTNCCIVGGMLGALHGYSNIPKEFVEAVKGFDPTKKEQGGVFRPTFLVVRESAEKILKEIILMRPRNATIIGGQTGFEKSSA